VLPSDPDCPAGRLVRFSRRHAGHVRRVPGKEGPVGRSVGVAVRPPPVLQPRRMQFTAETTVEPWSTDRQCMRVA